jgi:hypothetical protein
MEKGMTIFEIIIIVVSLLYTMYCILSGSPNYDVVCMGNMILCVILTAKNCLIRVINRRFNDYLELKHVEFAWKREKLEVEDNG